MWILGLIMFLAPCLADDKERIQDKRVGIVLQVIADSVNYEWWDDFEPGEVVRPYHMMKRYEEVAGYPFEVYEAALGLYDSYLREKEINLWEQDKLGMYLLISYLYDLPNYKVAKDSGYEQDGLVGTHRVLEETDDTIVLKGSWPIARDSVSGEVYLEGYFEDLGMLWRYDPLSHIRWCDKYCKRREVTEVLPLSQWPQLKAIESYMDPHGVSCDDSNIPK